MRALVHTALLALTLLVVACRSETAVETQTSIATVDEKGVVTINRSPRVPAVPVRLDTFCDHWASLPDRAPEFATAPANTPPDMRINFDATTAFVWSLAETAPNDAKRDFHGYAIVWSSYADRVIEGGYDFTALEIDDELRDSLRSAGAKVSAWARANCAAALTVPTDTRISLLGIGAPLFPSDSAERSVQGYLKAVASRDVTAALSWLPADLVTPCRDALREAISLRESNEVRASLDRTIRDETTTQVRAEISESFGESAARRPAIGRSVVFDVRRIEGRWLVVNTSWPVQCPPPERPR